MIKIKQLQESFCQKVNERKEKNAHIVYVSQFATHCYSPPVIICTACGEKFITEEEENQIKEYYKESNSLIFGDEKDKKDMLMSLMLIITRGVISTKFENDLSEEITSTVVELSVLNEIGSRLCGKSCYNLGNNNLLPIKKQLYPYWLMYLGYVDEETVLKKIFKDNKDFKVNLAFDITKYKVDKNLKKLNISQFLEYCIRNSNTIINIQAYELIDDDVEVI